MAREVVALVSADDVVATVRVHADRVHDLLRRNDVPEEQTLTTAFRHAGDLVDAVAGRPETVIDLAGWWFGRCLSAFTADPFTVEPDSPRPDGPRSVLAGTEVEQAVRAAIAELPRHERVAVMLRDAYDLPLQAVAVALDRSPETAAELVASGRLHLMSAYDGLGPPDRSGHIGRQPLDLGALSATADGSAEPAAALSTRRHVSACPACEELSERLGRARRLALGLPVLAMADADREALLEAVRERADAVLPTHDEVLAAAAADSRDHGVPALLVLGALLLAAVLGVAVGVLSRHAENASAPVAAGPLPSLPVTPSTSPAPVVTSRTSSPPTTRTRRTLPPIIIRTSRAAPTASTPTSAPPTTATTANSAPSSRATIALDPSSGPNGTTITVTGSGFTPDVQVAVSYDGQQQTTVLSDATGGFTTTVTADAAIPGAYPVTADDGIKSASRTFRQTV